MSKRVIAFLIGSMLILVSPQDKPKTPRKYHYCDVFKRYDELEADCSFGRIIWFVVPIDLGENLQVLDISVNQFDILRSKSFVKYPLLREIIMFNLFARIKAGVIVENGTFAPLLRLKTLRMSGTYFDNGDLSGVIWPPSLRILHIDESNLQKTLNFENLTNLRHFSAHNSSMISLPKFHFILPSLKFVNLFGNPIQTLTLEEIAPLCNLEVLQIDSMHKDFELLTKPFFCECIRIKKWIYQFEIEGFVSSCYIYRDRNPPKCDTNFGEKILSMREACLAATECSSFSLTKNLILILLAIGFILLIVFIAYISYYVYKNYTISINVRAIPTKDPNESINEEDARFEEETAQP